MLDIRLAPRDRPDVLYREDALRLVMEGRTLRRPVEPLMGLTDHPDDVVVVFVLRGPSL